MIKTKSIPYGAYVEEVLKNKREQNEILRNKTIEKTWEALDELRKKIEFHGAFIFGSLARPYGFNQDSDVDIAFLILDDKDFFFAMAFLSKRLYVDVDIAQMESSNNLKRKILSEGIPWKKKN